MSEDAVSAAEDAKQEEASSLLDFTKVKERCASGRIGAGERAWAWRLLLGVIPESGEPKAVEAALRVLKSRYDQLRQEHLPDISTVSKSDDAGDPLSLALAGSGETNGNSSGWTRFYASADLRAEIQKDLDRLVLSGLPEDHFARSSFAPCMLTVLTVWATAHAKVGYRQGMHEILALVVLALEDETAYGCGLSVDDEASREADMYALFDAIMAGHADAFLPGTDAPVVQACRRAQSELLATVEPRLARRLESVEPQLYGLRWFRLLFLREFDAPANLVLCDAVFAAARKADPSSAPDPAAFQEAVLRFFVSLLLACAPTLLATDDEMECLSILMRPPQTTVRDVLRLSDRVARGLLESEVKGHPPSAHHQPDRPTPIVATTPLFRAAPESAHSPAPHFSAPSHSDDLANILFSVRLLHCPSATAFELLFFGAGSCDACQVRQHS